MVKFLSSRSMQQRRGLGCFTESQHFRVSWCSVQQQSIHVDTKSLVQRVFVAMNMSARPSIQNIWNDPEYKYLSRRGLAAGHKNCSDALYIHITRSPLSSPVSESLKSVLESPQSPAVAPPMPATAALALMHPSCSCSSQVWPRTGGSRGRVTCP